jgi:hypothetical protein
MPICRNPGAGQADLEAPENEREEENRGRNDVAKGLTLGTRGTMYTNNLLYINRQVTFAHLDL